MVLIVAIIGMIIIMVRERNRVLVIETEAQTIHRVVTVYFSGKQSKIGS